MSLSAVASLASGRGAFWDCFRLASVDIPGSVTNIGDSAFLESGLTRITIPASVTSIGPDAFAFCQNLTNISVDPQNAVYSSINGVLFDKSQTILLLYPCGLAGSYTIPSGVTRIGTGAFAFCNNLTTLTFPASVTNLDDGAIDNCASLTSLYFLGNAPAAANPIFGVDVNLTVYYLPGTAGWNVLFDGLPPVLTPAGDYLWTTNAGVITITQYTGPGGAVGIPALITGLPVTRIGDQAFYSAATVTSITLPDGVISLGDAAFEGCQNLRRVDLPGSLTSIGAATFSQSGLTSVALSAAVTNIGTQAFYACRSLTNIAVSAQNSFYSSTNGVLFDRSQTTLVDFPGGLYQSYTIPNGVTTLAPSAFAAANLTNVMISATVTNLGDEPFSSCQYLGVITVAAQNPLFASIDGVLFNKSLTTLVEFPCGLIGSYTIPGGVTSIGDSAFVTCYFLAGVTIPTSVTAIGTYAFQGSGVGAITIPAGVTNWDYAFASSSLTNVVLAGGLTAIAPYAFSSCGNLVSVAIPGSVTNIGEHAFEFCFALGSLTIANGVSSIGADAFASCQKLLSVTLPASVASIGPEAFGDSVHLTAINVAAQNLFYSSSNGVVFDKNQTTLVEFPSGLGGNYTIPGGVTRIGVDAFYASTLTNITIPNGVTSLGDGAFEFCTYLASITIPGSVTNIGAGVFNGCDYLTNITVEATNALYTSVSGVVFDKSQATLVAFPDARRGSYRIPAGVTRIGDGAFEFSDLASITIPGSVTSLAPSAFAFLFSTSLYFTGPPPAVVSTNAFDADFDVTLYYLPRSSGWPTFSSNSELSVTPWNPAIPIDDTFGVRSNQFGFTITAPSSLTVVVETCTNLANPVWIPLQTVTLTNGSYYFCDPQWTNSSGRYYGLGFP